MTRLSRVSGPAPSDAGEQAARDAYEADIANHPIMAHTVVHETLAPNGRICCPICRRPPQGMLQIGLSEAYVNRNTDKIVWEGYSDTWWDTTITLRKRGLPIMTCWNGHLFTHPRVTGEPTE